MQYDVMLAVHAAMRLRPGVRRHVPVGCLLRLESQNDGENHGHRFARQYGGGLIAGGGRVCRDALRLKSARKRAVPRYRLYRDLAHKMRRGDLPTS